MAGKMNFDPIAIELFRHRFAGIAEEMGVALRRTAYSPNIKERLDFSCALFDAEGQLIAQAAHIPVHLGAMPASVEAARRAVEKWQPGDVIFLNDPFAGGTHLPDLTMVAPVFLDQKEEGPAFFVANRAHHADVGGMSPASLPLSTEIFQEGVILPPLHFEKAGLPNEEVLKLFLRNVRTPKERRGDLAAQRASLALGEKRLGELAQRHGAAKTKEHAATLLRYSEKRSRHAIAHWPDGQAEHEDFLELDEGGTAQKIRIKAKVTIHGDEVMVDFTGTDPQGAHSLNAVSSITQSSVFYVLRCLLPEDIPDNAGCFSPARILIPDGSVLAARPPAAVAAGNVETSQRVVDVVLSALGKILDHVPACSQGTMNNLTIGGLDQKGAPFAYYETIGGGMGASAEQSGLSGVQVHMTNTWNTPIEAMEMTYPIRITHYGLRRGSGGRGAQRGGEGIIREMLFVNDASFTLISGRRALGPPGKAGGEDGAVGKNTLIDSQSTEERLPGKCQRRVKAGMRLRVETPGGGGYGSAD